MLTLKTTTTVTKINRKSSSPCFKDLKVGDIIEFSVPIKYAGYASHGTCATYIRCYNRRTNAESRLSFNQLDRVLECCELVETQEYRLQQIKQEFDEETDKRQKDISQMLKEWKE